MSCWGNTPRAAIAKCGANASNASRVLNDNKVVGIRLEVRAEPARQAEARGSGPIDRLEHFAIRFRMASNADLGGPEAHDPQSKQSLACSRPAGSAPAFRSRGYQRRAVPSCIDDRLPSARTRRRPIGPPRWIRRGTGRRGTNWLSAGLRGLVGLARTIGQASFLVARI